MSVYVLRFAVLAGNLLLAVRDKRPVCKVRGLGCGVAEILLSPCRPNSNLTITGQRFWAEQGEDADLHQRHHVAAGNVAMDSARNHQNTASSQ